MAQPISCLCIWEEVIPAFFVARSNPSLTELADERLETRFGCPPWPVVVGPGFTDLAVGGSVGGKRRLGT